MTDEDLSQLKIDKSQVFVRPKRRRKAFYLITAALFAAVITALFYKGLLTPAVTVEVANVTKIYPSQTFTLLNAGGYVAAQRKAAVASKVTGRLVSLSVEEGAHVKEGQTIARLENDDVAAARDRAAADLEFAKTDLERAKAEMQEATLSYKRNRDLLSQGLVTQAADDASYARYKKAAAAVGEENQRRVIANSRDTLSGDRPWCHAGRESAPGASSRRNRRQTRPRGPSRPPPRRSHCRWQTLLSDTRTKFQEQPWPVTL